MHGTSAYSRNDSDRKRSTDRQDRLRQKRVRIFRRLQKHSIVIEQRLQI